MALVLGKAEGAFQLYMQIQIEVGLHCMQLNGNTVGFPNQKQKGTATKMLSRQRAQLYTRSMIPPAPILQLQPWRYHTSFFFFFTQVLLKHYSIDVAPTAHAYDTHSYRFVVFQILLVAFHAQICQPSSNWRCLCFWSHCLQVSRKHTRQYRGKLDKLCAVYANQGQSYCILPYLCSNCIFTTCGDKFSKHNIHLCCS